MISMRRNGLALAVSAAVLAACGGGGSKSGAADSTATTSTTTTTAATTAAPAAGAATTGAAGAAATTSGTAMPITGKTWDVKMMGDDKGYRYEPANLTVKVGDGVRFTNVAGGPHNVAFGAEPDASKGQLDANMPAATSAGSTPKMASLSSPLLTNPNDTYTISFAGVQPGKYDFFCTPHQALGMKGEITVQ